MPKHKIEVVFSLIFFFFAVFLFLSVLSFAFVKNFDNVLVMLVQPDGFFIHATRLTLFIGLCAALLLLWKKRLAPKKYRRFVLFNALLFAALISFNLFFVPKINILETVLDYDSLKRIILANTEILVVDSAFFIYFVAIPAFDFFYKKFSLDTCFYQLYIRDVAPSLNISLVFLFGFIVQQYDFYDTFFAVRIGLGGLSVILALVVVCYSSLSLQLFINALLLVGCFVVFASMDRLNVNLYYVRLFFYALGLLYWMFSVAAELEGQ